VVVVWPDAIGLLVTWERVDWMPLPSVVI
jgi:hypothetical protein